MCVCNRWRCPSPPGLDMSSARGPFHMLRAFWGVCARFLQHPMGHCWAWTLAFLNPPFPPNAEPQEEDLRVSRTTSNWPLDVTLRQCPSLFPRPGPHGGQDSSASSAAWTPVTFHVLKSHLSLKISRCFFYKGSASPKGISAASC